MKKIKKLVFGKYVFQKQSDDERVNIKVEIKPGLLIIVLVVVVILVWRFL